MQSTLEKIKCVYFTKIQTIYDPQNAKLNVLITIKLFASPGTILQKEPVSGTMLEFKLLLFLKMKYAQKFNSARTLLKV